MKLYGSFQNRLIETMVGTPTPAVGMGVTIISYSDRNPATIVSVNQNGKEFHMQRDTVKHDPSKEGGMGHQNWLIEPNAGAAIERVTLRKDGKWHIGTRMSGSVVIPGIHQAHHDWEF